MFPSNPSHASATPKIPLATRRCRTRFQQGSAMMETALVLPTLLLLACGAMDLARVFYAGVVVHSAARASVQVGSYCVGKAGATSEMNAAAQADAADQGITGMTTSSRTFCACSTSSAEVSCSATCSGSTPAGYVEATASYTFTPLVKYPGIPQSIPITSVLRMRAQ
jgi:Flp pilus assembly protein TadG